MSRSKMAAFMAGFPIVEKRYADITFEGLKIRLSFEFGKRSEQAAPVLLNLWWTKGSDVFPSGEGHERQEQDEEVVVPIQVLGHRLLDLT